MTITAQLRRYARGEGQCGHAALVAAVGISSKAGGGAEAVHDRIAGFARKAIDRWAVLARRLDIPLPRAIRNLFAFAEAEDLPALLLVLEWGLLNAAFFEQAGQNEHSEQIDQGEPVPSLSALPREVRRRLPGSLPQGNFDPAACQLIARRVAADLTAKDGAFDAALAAVAKRRFEKEPLGTLVPFIPWLDQSRLEAVIFESVPSRKEADHSSRLDVIRAWPPSLHRSALLFLGTDAPRRLGVLEQLPAAHRGLLLRRLPARDWAETLVAARGKARRVAVVRRFDAARRADVLRAHVEHGAGQCPADVLALCLPHADEGTFAGAIQGDEASAKVLAARPPLLRKALRVLGFCADTRVYPPHLATPVFVNAALREFPRTAQDVFGYFVARGPLKGYRYHSPEPDTAFAALRELLARGGLSGLLEAYEHGITARQFEEIGSWAAAGSPGSRPSARASNLQALFDFKTRRGHPAWEAALVCARKANKLPGYLRDAIAASTNKDIVRRAVVLCPADFADLAVKRLPLREQLVLAFELPAVAHAAEARTSRRRLLAELPWVRSSCEGGSRPHELRPASKMVAAAYELALAFSLEHARYLAWLARQVEVPLCGAVAGMQFDHLYRTYELPKKSGGTRTITAPDPTLKCLQRRILQHGLAKLPVHRAAHGFRRGRSVRTNALPHVGQPLVVNVDIHAFFPSTPYAAIVEACSGLAGGGLSPAAVRLAADICSYGGALPTGAPTSPALANVLLRPVDRAVAKAAARHGIRYTRYADDLTFSGAAEVHRIIPFVKKLLAERGYTIEDRKTNLFRRGRRQMVTGLVVNDKPNLPRRLRRRLRAAVHHRSVGLPVTWRGRTMGDSELSGRLAALNVVQPAEARRLKDAVRHAQDPAPAPVRVAV